MLVAKKPLYQPAYPNQTLPNPSRRPKKAANSISVADKGLVIGAVLAMAVMSFGLVWRFAAVNDMQYRVVALEKQLATLENDNASLTIQAKQLGSASRVEAKAIAELGMQWPKQKQIVNVVQGPVPAN